MISFTVNRFNDVLNLLLVGTVLFQVAAASFEPSEFDTRWATEVDAEANRIDFVTSENNNNYDNWIADTFRFSGNDNTMLEAFQAVSLVVPKKKCSTNLSSVTRERFGLNDEYTLDVCGTFNVGKNIVCPNESSCDASQIPFVVAGKGATLDLESGSNYDLAWAICLAENDWDKTQCTLGSTDPLRHNGPATTEGTTIKNTIPDGFNYPLLTYEAEKVPASGIPHENYVLGDGKFELSKRVFSAAVADNSAWSASRADYWATLDAKISTIHTLVYQYAFNAFPGDEMKKEFYHDVMLGYFMQRYGGDYFGSGSATGSPRSAIIDGSFFKYRTACAVAMGAMISHYCGYGAGDIEDFMTWYYNSSSNLVTSTGNSFYVANKPMCGAWTPNMWHNAKRAMRLDSGTPAQTVSTSNYSSCDAEVFMFRSSP